MPVATAPATALVGRGAATILLCALAAGVLSQGIAATYDFGDGVRLLRLNIPASVTTVRGIVIHGNGANENRTSFATDPELVAYAESLGFAVLATGYWGNFVDPNEFVYFEQQLGAFATASGHAELVHAPLGHSSGGAMSYGFNHLRPEKVIAFITSKAGYYITSPPSDAALRTPGLLISGELDQEFRRVNNRALFTSARPRGALWSWVEEEATGHSEANSQHLELAFLADLSYSAALSVGDWRKIEFFLGAEKIGEVSGSAAPADHAPGGVRRVPGHSRAGHARGQHAAADVSTPRLRARPARAGLTGDRPATRRRGYAHRRQRDPHHASDRPGPALVSLAVPAGRERDVGEPDGRRAFLGHGHRRHLRARDCEVAGWRPVPLHDFQRHRSGRELAAGHHGRRKGRGDRHDRRDLVRLRWIVKTGGGFDKSGRPWSRGDLRWRCHTALGSRCLRSRCHRR